MTNPEEKTPADPWLTGEPIVMTRWHFERLYGPPRPPRVTHPDTIVDPEEPVTGITKIGAFLQNLELAERSQAPGVYLAESIAINGLHLTLRDAESIDHTFSADATGLEILSRLRSTRPSIRITIADGIDTWDDAPGVWHHWSKLHYDLGSLESELAVGNARLHYDLIKRVGSHALIRISDGIKTGEYWHDLEAGDSTGLPVDLASSFRNGKNARVVDGLFSRRDDEPLETN